MITLDGTLIINKQCPKSNYGENVQIGVSIKAPRLPRSNQDWQEVLSKSKVIKGTTKGFQQTFNSWFEGGTTWVIATPLFGTTKIKIVLEPSALITTGFAIETYLRKLTTIHVIEPNAAYGAGVTIEFEVKWEFGAENLDAVPKVTASS